MPTFLWFYVAGLAASLGVGFVFYCLLGPYCAPMFQKLFGDRAGQLWGRTFRMLVVTTALVGGLSTQWYGCHGYDDYQQVEKNPRVMFEKSTEQVAGAIHSASGFVLLAAGMSAIAYALLWRGRKEEENPKHKIRNPKQTQSTNLETSKPPPQ